MTNPRRPAVLAALLLAFAFLLAYPALAAGGSAVQESAPGQSIFESQLAEWEATAKRAEEALREGRASNGAFDVLRSEIAAQRTKAFEIIARGDVAADVIRAQIDALGAPPAKDATEPEAVAKRRAELEARLATAEAPIRATREAYSRAEVLISKIDSLLRARFRATLLERLPSPLVPTLWLPALTDTAKLLERVGREIVDTLATDYDRGTLPRILLTSLALAAAGLFVILFLGPAVNPRLDARAAVARGWRGALLRTLSLLVSLAVPAIGAGLIVLGFVALNLDLHAIRNSDNLAVAVAVLMVGANWVADFIFAPGVPERRAIDIDERPARLGKRLCLALGMILSIQAVLETAAENYDFTPGTRSVVSGLMVFAGSYCLWGLADLLLRADAKLLATKHRQAKERPFDFLHLLARLVQISAVAAAIAVAIGYVAFARHALDPMIVSLAVIGMAIACYRGLMFLARLLFERRSRGENPILLVLPLVFGLVIVLALQPILALAWGARLSDLTEIWVVLVQGVVIGGTRISIGVLSILIAVFLIGIVATRWLQRLLSQAVLPRTRLDRGGQNAVLTGLGYVGVTLSALLAVSMAGLDLSNLAIVAGALSVGIGFGLQAIVSNFVSGIILLVERPIKEGDWIEVSGFSGIVRKIAVRATRIETFDRHEVIVPNSDLVAGTVKNMTLSSRTGRVIVPVGIAYGSDVDAAKEVLLDAARRHPIVLDDPAPLVLFMGLGESSLDFELRCFIDEISSGLSTRSDLLFDIYRDLGKAGIEIPFPQRDLNLRNVDELAKAVARIVAAGGKGVPEA